ncbi:MAG: DegT/DnrJ/EryC1/StrS family aminotransferase, partial [Prevotella sp.]|nr:DegT/DnrJ/EryC1/StrS family aminotransferase [Prevotella sp.]
AYLADCGVQTMIHYPVAPHHQECYAKAKWNNPRLSLPITEKIHAQELSIPINQVLATDEAHIVVDALNSFIG